MTLKLGFVWKAACRDERGLLGKLQRGVYLNRCGLGLAEINVEGEKNGLQLVGWILPAGMIYRSARIHLLRQVMRGAASWIRAALAGL